MNKIIKYFLPLWVLINLILFLLSGNFLLKKNNDVFFPFGEHIYYVHTGRDANDITGYDFTKFFDITEYDYTEFLIYGLVIPTLVLIIVYRKRLVIKAKSFQRKEKVWLWSIPLLVVAGAVILILFKSSNNIKKELNSNDKVNNITTEENNIIGSWSYYDSGAGVNYRCIINSDGTYMMTDFGGDGITRGNWKSRGNTITFFDDSGIPALQGSIDGNSLNVRTSVGTIHYRKN